MEEKKYLNLDGITLYDSLLKNFILGKKFIGTTAEYEEANANGEIPINTIVVITDDESSAV